MVVVDASCAVKWFVPEDGWEAARRLLADGSVLVAPDILAMETANALARKHRRREAAAELPVRALDLLASLGVQASPHAPLLRAATELAVRERRAVYDCLYLALAERRGAPLATFDGPLAALARRRAVPLWSPEPSPPP